MAIKIDGATVITNSRRGVFRSVNPGAYETSARPSGAAEGDVIYDSDEKNIYVWNGSEWLAAGGGGGNSLNPSIPPFVSRSGPKTRLTNTDGKIVFSLDNVNFSADLTIEPNTIFYSDWTSDINSAVQGQSYSSEVNINYVDLGITEVLEIKINQIDKIPDPFSFTPQTDVIAGTTLTSNPVAMLGSINAPTYVWGSTDSPSAQINIAELGWVPIPPAPTDSVMVTSKDQLEVRHQALTGALTDTTTTINVGISTGEGDFESADFVTTNFNSYIITPSITSPTNGQVTAGITVTLGSSSFQSVGGLTHQSTDWEVATDTDFQNIVWSAAATTSNLTSITTSSLPVTQLYVRVRYRDTVGAESAWSDTVTFDTPFAVSPDTGKARMTAADNMDINESISNISIQPGTYKITIWGAGGGKGSGGGASGGGAGGSVERVFTYNSVTNISFTIGQPGQEGKGGCHENSCGGGAVGGSPGGGNGTTGDWRGGSGGGYSSFSGMTAGGGGGGGAQGAGQATGGGQNPSTGSNSGAGWGGAGCAGNGGGSGSSGSGGGGGGAGSHRTENSSNSCSSGNGGNNGGTFDTGYGANFGTPGNPYNSAWPGRRFGNSAAAGGGRIQKV